MKLVVKMDLAQGRGSICWKGATWRRSWRVCVTLGGLLLAGNLMVETAPAHNPNKGAPYQTGSWHCLSGQIAHLYSIAQG